MQSASSTTITARRTDTLLGLVVLMRVGTTFPKEGRGDQPHLKLYNKATLASIGGRRIPQLSDIRNFLGELLRTPSIRSSQNSSSTWVNKGGRKSRASTPWHS